jgi:hypothetical protein
MFFCIASSSEETCSIGNEISVNSLSYSNDQRFLKETVVLKVPMNFWKKESSIILRENSVFKLSKKCRKNSWISCFDFFFSECNPKKSIRSDEWTEYWELIEKSIDEMYECDEWIEDSNLKNKDLQNWLKCKTDLEF